MALLTALIEAFPLATGIGTMRRHHWLDQRGSIQTAKRCKVRQDRGTRIAPNLER